MRIKLLIATLALAALASCKKCEDVKPCVPVKYQIPETPDRIPVIDSLVLNP